MEEVVEAVVEAKGRPHLDCGAGGEAEAVDRSVKGGAALAFAHLVHRLYRAKRRGRPREGLLGRVQAHAHRRHRKGLPFAVADRLWFGQRHPDTVRGTALLARRRRRHQLPRDRVGRRLEQPEAARLGDEARLHRAHTVGAERVCEAAATAGAPAPPPKSSRASRRKTPSEPPSSCRPPSQCRCEAAAGAAALASRRPRCSRAASRTR